MTAQETQETKFKEIADAIRMMEGSKDPIIAEEFAARILALPKGGGSFEMVDGWDVDKISAVVHLLDFSGFTDLITIEVLEGY